MKYRAFAFRVLTPEERKVRVINGFPDVSVEVVPQGDFDLAGEADDHLRKKKIGYKWGWVQKRNK